MEPINRRPVMDIKPQRPQTPPLPRSNFNPTPVDAPPAPVSLPPQPSDSQSSDPQPATHQTGEPPKVKKPVLAIVVAILVGGGLIGLAVFGYIRSNDKDSAASSTVTTPAQKATTTDVDDSLKSTDDQLNSLDDVTDFNSNNLSDNNLGL